MTDAEASIQRTAALTGVSPATLRAWEARHGFPQPHRLPGGHRRYSEADIERIRQVQKLHAEGLSIPAAVARVRETTARPASTFVAVRDVLPDATPQRLPKVALIAISHALEDECAWRAEAPILVGGFQHRRFYEAEQDRWTELTATAAGAFVVAEDVSPDGDADGRAPVPVPVRRADLTRREWFVVCRSATFCGVLVGWERPRRRGQPRRFEVLWTLEPEAAAAALDTVAAVADRRAPAAARRLRELQRRTPLPAPPDGATVLAVSRRIVEYLAARL